MSALRSAEWAQAHGLPLNPHRGNGPSITFYGPGGAIRRHIALSEASLRPPPRESRAGFALLPASFEEERWQLEEASSPKLARQGVLTDSVVTIGSTEQLWVFEDGVLITKTIIVTNADTLIGASQLAFDELGELTAEQWVTASSMGAIDPEDPQWEMSNPLYRPRTPAATLLAACEVTVNYDDCGWAIAGAVAEGIVVAGLGYACVKSGISCSLARWRARVFAAKVATAIAVCLGDETRLPSAPDAATGQAPRLTSAQMGRGIGVPAPLYRPASA